VVAPFHVGAEWRRRGAEDERLFEQRAGQVALLGRFGDRQQRQRAFRRGGHPKEDGPARRHPDRGLSTADRRGRPQRLLVAFGAAPPEEDEVGPGQDEDRRRDAEQDPAPHSSQPSGQATSPRSWTSGSSTTPKRSWTRRRPSAISPSTSAVVVLAPPFST